MERRNPHLKSPLDDLFVMAMTGLAKAKYLSWANQVFLQLNQVSETGCHWNQGKMTGVLLVLDFLTSGFDTKDILG